MQRHLEITERFEDVQEWLVAVSIRLVKDVIKIANGLVIMQDEAEAECVCHVCRRARGGRIERVAHDSVEIEDAITDAEL
jgi:hypothetical protein